MTPNEVFFSVSTEDPLPMTFEPWVWKSASTSVSHLARLPVRLSAPKFLRLFVFPPRPPSACSPFQLAASLSLRPDLFLPLPVSPYFFPPVQLSACPLLTLSAPPPVCLFARPQVRILLSRCQPTVKIGKEDHHICRLSVSLSSVFPCFPWSSLVKLLNELRHCGRK